MNQKCVLFIFLTTVIFTSAAQATTTSEGFKGVWKGVEVMGADSKTAKKVRKLIPIKKGAPFTSSDSELFQTWCSKVKDKIDAKQVRCGFIGYLEGEYYYNVEIVPKNGKERTYRTIPSTPHKVYKIPKNLNALYEEWNEKFWSLFKAGINPKETDESDYLDYENPELHLLAVKLSKIAKRNNSLLLNIIRNSEDPVQRSKAATMLSWSRHPENLSKILEWDLLNDPDNAVRNDLARSFLFYLNKIDDEEVLNKSIHAFCEQAELPSHGDRNKALTSLYRILETHPNLKSNVSDECRNTLAYISEMSILVNSGGIADSILAMIEQSDDGKGTGI